MESCRSVFLAKLYSVMTRPLRCVVASGPGRLPPVRAAPIGLLFGEKCNNLSGPCKTDDRPGASMRDHRATLFYIVLPVSNNFLLGVSAFFFSFGDFTNSSRTCLLCLSHGRFWRSDKSCRISKSRRRSKKGVVRCDHAEHRAAFRLCGNLSWLWIALFRDSSIPFGRLAERALFLDYYLDDRRLWRFRAPCRNPIDCSCAGATRIFFVWHFGRFTNLLAMP